MFINKKIYRRLKSKTKLIFLLYIFYIKPFKEIKKKIVYILF